LLPFDPEASVLSSVEKYKNYNIKHYSFALGSLWVRKLVSDIKGGA
jgi:hypothetical protein